jgi:hypothetical protein
LYGGIDLHARTMSLCIVNQDGEIVLHRQMRAAPAPFLQAIAPSREDLVVCVECLCPWYGLADLGTPVGIPFGWGHALSMTAMHGGKAQHERIDAHKMAVLRRGGRLPQASGSPAEMRPSRDLRRRRRGGMRHRAALLAHVPQTHRPDHRPEIGKKLAAQGTREGGAERCADPAVHTRSDVDLALIDSDDRRRSELEWALVKTANPHDAPTFYRRQSVPGSGTILAPGRRDEIHTRQRFPRGQPSLARWAKTPGQGQALPVLAPQLARAVSDMCTPETAFDMRTFLHESWSGVGEPVASREHRGLSLGRALCNAYLAAAVNA